MKRISPKDKVCDVIEFQKKKPRIISFVGAGGKTTLIFRLAEELKESGFRVIITTTTKMYLPRQGFLPWKNTGSEMELENLIKSRLHAEGVMSVGQEIPGKGKFTAVPREMQKRLAEFCDVLLVEADGSKRKPVKVPADHEPVLFPGTDLVVGVLGSQSIGKRIRDAAHRPEDVATFLHTDTEHRITEEDLQKIADSPQGLKKHVGCEFVAVENEYMNYYEQLKESMDQKLVSLTWLSGDRTGEKELIRDVDLLPEGLDGQIGIFETAAGRVFVEPIIKAPVCVICGAGHVGLSMMKLAAFAGFKVIVLEDRPTFADEARRSGAHQVICDSFEQGLAKIEGGREVYFVVMTRGHRYDEVCLEQILKKTYAYVGMMSSRGRAARMRTVLEEKGIEANVLEEIHMPIGLSICAKMPEEIAVSIVAQMIEVKNQAGMGSFFDRAILDGILGKEGTEPWVLATIIKRAGSAPRDVGTKMLLTDCGRTIGSIGGGCMEAEVLQKARLLLKSEEKLQVVKADMSGTQAENDGMVCGGTVEVLLEVVR